jgi:glucose/arabinose dehydrogenase
MLGKPQNFKFQERPLRPSRGRALYRFNLDAENPVLTARLEGAFGRLRTVVAGPRGLLYILTSNRDGRTMPAAQDDLLLVVNPGLF